MYRIELTHTIKIKKSKNNYYKNILQQLEKNYIYLNKTTKENLQRTVANN